MTAHAWSKPIDWERPDRKAVHGPIEERTCARCGARQVRDLGSDHWTNTDLLCQRPCRCTIS